MSARAVELELHRIEQHPKNPRHKAAPDQELVDSIITNGLVQPLIVAPLPAPAGWVKGGGEYWANPKSAGDGLWAQRYVLIAGHRRLAALKKAKIKTALVVIRDDLVTEGQQIEAMLIENGRRVDLTPIEEAEGYAELELLGYKPVAIATAVGRDIKTVRARLKLLKLSPATRKKVHTGQLTLEHAAQLIEFADDPETTKKLEAAARNDGNGTGVSLDYELKAARRRRDALNKCAVEVAKLLQAGAIELTVPKGKTVSDIIPWYGSGPGQPARLERTPSTDWGQHKGCLAFAQDPGNNWNTPSVVIACTNPDSHAHLLDEEKAKDLAEREQQRAEREARVAAEKAAQELRVATATSVAEGAKVPPPIADLIRSLLPALLVKIAAEESRTVYQDLMGIAEEDRWDDYLTNPEGRGKKARALLSQHLDDLANYSDVKATRALVAALVAAAEFQLVAGWNRVDFVAHDYVGLLEEIGHTFVDVDADLAAKVAPAKQEAAS